MNDLHQQLPGDLNRPGWPFPPGAYQNDSYDWDNLDPFRQQILMWRAIDTLGLDATDGELKQWVRTQPHKWLMDWMDHRYVETHNGKDIWVSHPYRLTIEDLNAIWHLKIFDYKVKITGASIYNPGATIRVEIHAPDIHPFPKWTEGSK